MKNNSLMMAESQRAHVLIIPYPTRGHMLPLLDLTHLLSLRGLDITIVITPNNLSLLSSSSSSSSIRPLVLPFPSHPSGVESSNDRSSSTPNFYRYVQDLFSLYSPLLEWAQSTPHPPNAIISDMFLGWTDGLARELSIPRLVFSPSAALYLSITHYLWRDLPLRPPDCSHDPNYPISFGFLPNSPTYPWHQLSSLYKSYVKGEPVSEFLREGFLANTRSWGFVINTFDDLEAAHLDHLRRELGHSRVWAVGPLSAVSEGGRGGTGASSEGLMTWLDTCEVGSVVYVCFGSRMVLSAPQLAVVATGLEQSGVRFVWCVGEAGHVTEGFEERVAGRGLVIRGWAPQVEVLGHRAVGSFLTHCGWNSVLEGIVAGVVMLTWPMRADQYMNSRLTLEAQVGLRACEGADAVPDPEALARVLSASVGKISEQSMRAQVMREKAVEAMAKDGSSYKDIDALVAMLNELILTKE